MPDPLPWRQDVTTPAGPGRHPTRYENNDGADARRALVLILAARELVSQGVGRTGRTVKALREASLPIAAALEWPDAAVARQHIERSPRIERLYRRIRFGPAHTKQTKARGPSDAAFDELKADLYREQNAHKITQVECKELTARLKAIRHSEAIAQVRLFAAQFGLTLGPQNPT